MSLKLLFELSKAGSNKFTLPEIDVPVVAPACGRKSELELPELPEVEVMRHYTALARLVHGVEDGPYPLGSCTMKYNPKINEITASLDGFSQIHPLQPADTIDGCREVLSIMNSSLCGILGMDAVSFQPAAGAHGEMTSLLVMHKYLQSIGQSQRTKIIVPDSSHGTNPASAVAAGFEVVTIPSYSNGMVNMEALKAAVGDDTAAMMLTNPNTLGIFDKQIAEMAAVVHGAGALMYYDGANLNAIMGWSRPGDMGFDIVHVNLHKTFSTPHGGGGPGSGPIACKAFLKDYLPYTEVGYREASDAEKSIGKVKAFHGNFAVVVKALTYILTLGSDGLKDASGKAVLNANYLFRQIAALYDEEYRPCMHEFVVSASKAGEKWGVHALDIAKAMLDEGIHPPTIYFPLIVKEAMMFEPTETESRESIDALAETMRSIFATASTDAEALHAAPLHAYIARPDEVKAAKEMVVQWTVDN